MNHEHAESLFLSALEDRLPDAEKEAFVAHLAQCKECDLAFDDFKAVHALLMRVAQERFVPDAVGPEVIMEEVWKSSNEGRVVMWWKELINGLLKYFGLFLVFCLALCALLYAALLTAGGAHGVAGVFRLAEGIEGALVMLSAFVLAIMLPLFRRVFKQVSVLAPAFASIAVALFISRSFVQLQFGRDYAPAASIGHSQPEQYRDLVNAFKDNIEELARASNQQPTDLKRLEREQAEHRDRIVGLFESVVDRVDEMSKQIDERARSSPDAGSGQGVTLHDLRQAAPSIEVPEAIARREVSGEGYREITENEFLDPRHDPLSTFSIDVDTASYANVRRFLLTDSMLPPKETVRLEEFINYFKYDYPEPKGAEPISVTADVANAPWATTHRLVRIGLKAQTIPTSELPPSNLVFLVDTSGSMKSPDKLPLVRQSLNLLVDELRPTDRVALVAYAGSAGLVLPSTPGTQKEAIRTAIAELTSGGSTAGGAGLQLAYETARTNFIEGGNNRVILATDGDFNVGIASESELVSFIEEKRATGVYLSVLGVGTGNYQEAKMEKLADKGNGNFSYLDNLREAEKVLVREMTGTLFAVAKDVKVQVEFNPAKVSSYRLLGYENRALKKEDFNNDRKDAGEMGAGHQVTALYEIIPATDGVRRAVDELKYQKGALSDFQSAELLTVKVRFKRPGSETSELRVTPLVDRNAAADELSDDFRFVTAVAEFALILRQSAFKGEASLEQVIQRAKSAKGPDTHGDRAELVRLAETARLLSRGR